MCDVRLKYRAVISDDLLITAEASFRCRDDIWQVQNDIELIDVTLWAHKKARRLDWTARDHDWFADTWRFEVRQLLKEDDHDLLWQLNAAAEQQKHEGAV